MQTSDDVCWLLVERHLDWCLLLCNSSQWRKYSSINRFWARALQQVRDRKVHGLSDCIATTPCLAEIEVTTRELRKCRVLCSTARDHSPRADPEAMLRYMTARISEPELALEMAGIQWYRIEQCLDRDGVPYLFDHFNNTYLPPGLPQQMACAILILGSRTSELNRSEACNTHLASVLRLSLPVDCRRTHRFLCLSYQLLWHQMRRGGEEGRRHRD